jgi:uncharacterized protein
MPRLCRIAVVLTGCAFAQQIPDNLPPGMPLIIRDFDRTAEQAARNPNDVGYTLGVVNRDGLAWTKSYGFADAARSAPATSDTSYAIGYGAFSAVMLLQLRRDGVVHFSDPVEKYVPETKAVRNPYPDLSSVTLLQLAMHTSGLTLDAAIKYTTGPAGEWEKALGAALAHTSYEFEPGTHAALSNIDEPVLALALSRAAHQPYSADVKQKILLPLGMTHTEFAPDGAVHSTIGDLARFASFAMLGGPESVLSKSELEENYRRLYVTNSIAIPNPNEGFGIGFHGETWTSNHYYVILSVGNTGPGYEAALWFEPRRHTGVILLHQGSGGAALGQMIHTYVYTLNAQKNDAGRQDPVKPLPYTEENVSFDNRGSDIKLAGALTIPPGKGPFPAVVLIPKAGPLDRDEQMYNHRPFLVLADHLTRAGIAVLRADVRGVGKSGGKFAAPTPDDFAADAEAAIAYMKTRPEVDTHKIGLISHGEGGLAAPIVANRNRDLAYVVMLGAPAVPSAENSVQSALLNAEANGELYRKAEEQAAESRAVMSLVQQEQDPAELERKLRAFLAGKMPDAQLEARLRQWTSPAFRKNATYDPAVELRKLACPVLALYGDKDLLAPFELNLPAMRAALAAGGNKNFRVEAVADVNFLFQTADVGIGREANWTEETMSPLVMQKIGEWIRQRAAAAYN